MPKHDLEGLYRRYAPIIFRRCLFLLANEEEALDAVQDIFLKLQRKIDGFRGESGVNTWIFRVTTNHCLSVLRSMKRQREFLGHVRHESSETNGQDIEERLLRREMLTLLIGNSSKRKVQIFVHMYFDEMTQAEIAALMGISERAVRKSLKSLKDLASKRSIALDDRRAEET